MDRAKLEAVLRKAATFLDLCAEYVADEEGMPCLELEAGAAGLSEAVDDAVGTVGRETWNQELPGELRRGTYGHG